MPFALAPLTVAEALRVARETRAVEVSAGAIQVIARLFREQFGEVVPAVIVADVHTMRAAGDAVHDRFRNASHPTREPFVFHELELHAEDQFVAQLADSLREHTAVPVAVGSGTINDLTKLAAHRCHRPYMSVATAASMDGYTAFGASITHHGSKQTFDCAAPRVVIADLNIIASAPVEMNSWGYADLLAKVTAGADWILADALDVEPIDATAWNIVQGNLRSAVAAPDAVRSKDPQALRGLIEGLMLGGFAMQAMRSSRPASGAEHQFSHLWDMQHHTHNGSAPSHGLKVGIGTLAVTAIYELLLAQPLEHLDVDRCCAAWPAEEAWLARAQAEFCEDNLRAVAMRELQAKYIDASELRRQLKTLRKIWPALRDRLRAQLIPFTAIRSMLKAVGAATAPEEIGISPARLRASYWRAFSIRRRFTVLDLAVRIGMLDALLDQLFGRDGGWENADRM
jgi:glycerol-1-phosphate dehydrogenase [NAD(P)+]